MTQVGAVTVNMMTRTGQFIAGLKTADKGLKGFAGQASSASRTIRRVLGAAFAVAGIGSFGLALRQAGKDIDDLAKTSDSLGMTTQALAGMRHAADLAGVSTSSLDRAMAHTNRSLGEAAMGTGRARRYIEQMGLSIEQLQAMSPEQRFDAYAAGIQAMGSQSERAAASAALFGDRQGELIPMLMQSKEALDANRAEAEALGLATSRVDAAKVEDMRDALTRAKGVVSGMFRNIIVKIAPYIKAIANRFTDAAKNANGFGNVIGTVGTYVIKAAGLAADAWEGLGMVWQLLKIGIGRLAQGVLWMGDRFVKTGQIIGQTFTRTWDVIKAGFGVLTAVLSRGWNRLREGLARFVNFVGNAMRDLLVNMGENLRRVKGMEDIANDVTNAGRAIGRSTAVISANARRASQAAAVGVTAARAEMSRAAQAFVAPLEAEGSATLQRLGDRFRDAAELQTEALRTQALGPRHSERLEAFAATIVTEAQMRAQARADEIAEQQLHNEELAELEAHHKHDLLALDREAAEIRARIEQERLEATARHWQNFSSGMSSMLGNLARLQQSHSKRAQRIGLVAAKAKISQDTAAAAMASYQALAGIPIVGPALGAAAAAAAIAAGAVQMANAKSGAIGGGPSAPDTATGNHGGIHVPAAGDQQPQGQSDQRPATLVIDSDMAIDPYRLAESLNEALVAGYRFDRAVLR